MISCWTILPAQPAWVHVGRQVSGARLSSCCPGCRAIALSNPNSSLELQSALALRVKQVCQNCSYLERSKKREAFSAYPADDKAWSLHGSGRPQTLLGFRFTGHCCSRRPRAADRMVCCTQTGRSDLGPCLLSPCSRSVHPSVCLPVYPSISLFFRPSVCLSIQRIRPSIYNSIKVPISLSTSGSVSLSFSVSLRVPLPVDRCLTLAPEVGPAGQGQAAEGCSSKAGASGDSPGLDQSSEKPRTWYHIA